MKAEESGKTLFKAKNSDGDKAQQSYTALVPQDPLNRYMAEIRHHPLLTPQEEVEVAKKYKEAGDPEAAYRLVTANLRLVVKIAFEYHSYFMNLLDLIQEGNIGLMQAVKRFDPYRGIRLGSYAQWWIRAYILKYIIENYNLVKIGTTQAQRKLFFNLRKERDRLLQAGFRPEPKLLAESLNTQEHEVVEMQQRLGGAEISLEDQVGSSDQRVGDLLSSEVGSPEEAVAETEWQELLKGKMEQFREKLSGREQVIWEERLVAEDPVTLQSIGDRFGISRERARQLEARLKRRFKAFVEAEIRDARLISRY